MDEEKSWTVLIYANGNNDLDESIYREFTLLRNADLPENMNVAVQLARRQQPEENESGDLSGVRRYKIVRHEAILMENLGLISMADPLTFLNFLFWGSSAFPSEHLVVILSGHGGYFIGLLADYNGDDVRVMDFRKFTNSLALFQTMTHKAVDILVCDVCHMNMAEVMYELAATSGNAVKYVLLAQENPSLEGLPLPLLISRLGVLPSYTELTEECIRQAVAIPDSDLFGVELHTGCFECLKLLVSQLSEVILSVGIDISGRSCRFPIPASLSDRNLVSIQGLIDQLITVTGAAEETVKGITELLQEVLIYPDECRTGKEEKRGLNLFFPENRENYLLTRCYYDQLLFCHDNQWLRVLAEAAGKPESLAAAIRRSDYT